MSHPTPSTPCPLLRWLILLGLLLWGIANALPAYRYGAGSLRGPFKLLGHPPAHLENAWVLAAAVGLGFSSRLSERWALRLSWIQRRLRALLLLTFAGFFTVGAFAKGEGGPLVGAQALAAWALLGLLLVGQRRAHSAAWWWGRCAWISGLSMALTLFGAWTISWPQVLPAIPVGGAAALLLIGAGIAVEVRA